MWSQTALNNCYTELKTLLAAVMKDLIIQALHQTAIFYLISAFNLDKEHFYTAFMNDNLIGDEHKEALRANWGKFPTFPN